MSADTTSPERGADGGGGPQMERTIRKFASFAVGFSFISIATGIFTTYGTVLSSSGPVGIWTWPIVVVGQLSVALVFGVLASRIPLAGYSYQWASRLANPYIGWLIGWLAFMFLVIVVASVNYTAASAVVPALLGYEATLGLNWLVTALIIAVQALLIMFSTVWVERVNNAAVGAEIIGVLGITVLLLIVGAVAGTLHWGQLFSTGTVNAENYFSFGSLTRNSPWMLGFLLGAFTIVGFEACGNLAEETDEPARTVPRAMWSAVALAGVVGFAFLVALTVAAGNIPALTRSNTAVADIVTGTLGSGLGKVLLVVVLFAIFACGLVIFVTASRLVWAMSRDRRFPGHRRLGRVHPRFRTPFAATLAVFVLIEAALAAFATRTDTLFQLFSAATLLPALIYLSTVIVYVLTRRKLPVEHGFSLGRFEYPVIVVALGWLVFEVSIFRDSSFAASWAYVGVMLLVGLAYFAFMLLSGRPMDMPAAGDTVPVGRGDDEDAERASTASASPGKGST